MSQETRLPPQNHVARHCRKNDLDWFGVTPVGILECALIPDQDGISVTCVEFFGGANRQSNMPQVRAAVCTRLTPKVKSNRLAILNVGRIEGAGQANGAALRVIEDPDPPGNPGHALVKEPADLNDKKVREAIAATVQQGDIETY